MSLIVNHLSHIYEEGTAMSVAAVKDVNLKIDDGEFIGLIGHTGSGKSTFIQHLNGLIKPTSGEVYFEGADISDKEFDKKNLRSKVGLIFQYPGDIRQRIFRQRGQANDIFAIVRRFFSAGIFNSIITEHGDGGLAV